jgi:glutamate synthase domain-containing protein 2/rubredoxin
MAKYRCNVCNTFEYEVERGDSRTGIRPGTPVDQFPEDWRCPICDSDRSHLKPVGEPTRSVSIDEKVLETGAESLVLSRVRKVDAESYLGEWRREVDALEVHMEHIHRMSVTGESIIEPMRTRKDVIGWDEILIKGAQLARLPLNDDEEVSTRTVIGPRAERPLEIDTPLFVTHMSFGALSREVKIALAKGSAAVGTAIGSGEGGINPEVRAEAHRFIFEYVPNEYSVSPENLSSSDAIEMKVGQSAKPGMGAHLPAEKASAEIAAIRGFAEGVDIVSPARFRDVTDAASLRRKVDWLRDQSGGRPIGIKLAAGNIEADLAIALEAAPDFVTIDGRPGATGASPMFVKDATSIPTIFALHRARKFLDDHGSDGVSLVITGGLRVSSDFSKALAMGADAIALGTAALMAAACQQYRLCDTGLCPVGVTTQDPELRGRLRIDVSARKLENFLRVSTEELKHFARLTGKSDVHALSVSDLCTTSTEISGHTSIQHV